MRSVQDIENHLSQIANDIYSKLQEIGVESTPKYCLKTYRAWAEFGLYKVEYSISNHKNLTGKYNMRPYGQRALIKSTSNLQEVVDKSKYLRRKHLGIL
jgi:hypothetical protein